MAQETFTVNKPAGETNESVILPEDANTAFDFTSSEIQGMSLTTGGELVISFVDGGTLTISNFQDLADNNIRIATADGQVIDFQSLYQSLAADMPATDLSQPDAGSELVYILQPGQKYNFSADPQTVSGVEQKDGALLIGFDDNGLMVLQNFQDAMDFDVPAEIGHKEELVSLIEFFDNLQILLAMNEEMQEAPRDDMRSQPLNDGRLANLAQELSQIEPAAGDDPGGAGRGGFGFQSDVEPSPFGAPLALGPIGPTELQFDLPEPQDPLFVEEQENPAPTPPPLPSLEMQDQTVYEDGSVGLVMIAQSNAGANVAMTLEVSGIPAGWGVDANGGTYDLVTGTWTFNGATGQTNFTAGPILFPPADSDVDLPDLDVTLENTDTSTGLSSSIAGQIDVTTDAVADTPDLTANDSTADEDNPADVDISTAVTDTDGSEEITTIYVRGVPAGFTLSAGTDNGGGEWELDQTQLAGLQITPPADYFGTITLNVESVAEEVNKTDIDFDLTNDEASAFDDLDVTWRPVVDPPSVLANNGADDAQVYEDGSVVVPVVATLNSVDSPDAFLTVTVTGFDPAWGAVTAPIGDFNTAGTEWSITLPANTNLNTAFTFTPNADSDVDLTGLQVTATATEPATGTTADAIDSFNVITDAVADDPNLDVPDTSADEDSAADLTITTSPNDTDGSEEITTIYVRGVPAGFTLSAGTDNGGGEWELSTVDLPGLQVIPPADYFGTITLEVESIVEEVSKTDADFDLTNDEANALETVDVTWRPVIDPPSVLANNGADDAQVKEDGSVDVPVVATLNSVDSPDAFLTVTVTGFDPAWGAVTNTDGTFNAAGTEWSITLPANTNLDTTFTFTPAAQSDIDLTGLQVTATATEPATGTTADATDSFNIIVDAVADDPSITATGDTDVEGSTLDVDVAGALGADDFDGSESITGYQIFGVPAEVTFNNGTNMGGGVWSFTQAELAGLTATHSDSNFAGDITLTATVFNTENPVSDGEFDPTDNNNSASDTFTLSWKPVINPPSITVNNGVDEVQVKEDGSVDVDVVASLGSNPNTNEFLTVEVTGIDPDWGFSAPTGTYVPGISGVSTGTWTVVLPAGDDLNTVMTFTPPAQSDIDLTGLNATVVATDPDEGLTASDSDSFFITVDAVADDPSITANGDTGVEGSTLDVDIAGALGVDDFDGSESITGYQISGVPAGFTFNNGTPQGGGVWSFTEAQLPGLTITANDPEFDGSIDLTATVFTEETSLSGGEFDTGDNTNSATDTLTLTWTPEIDPPSIKVNNGIDDVVVKEDGSVDVDITASLSAGASADEFLTVEVTGIDSGWGFSAPVGTYDATTETWTVVLPAGDDLNTVMTFTPPAQSDIDLTGLVATATATDPVEGLNASSNDGFNIITDAVADDPSITANGDTGVEGSTLDVDIAGALGVDDFDGSESITGYTISGVPAGFTFNKGTEDPVGSGVWKLDQTDLPGLTITADDPDFDGTLDLTATIHTVDTPNDSEFDTGDNTAQASADFSVTWTPEIDPPTIKVNNGAGDAQVKEDGSVDVDVDVSLSADAEPGEVLSVTITGFDPAWGAVSVAGGIGNFINAGTEWTITLPANTNLDTVFTFTPAAQSDIDLTGLQVTATATDPAEGIDATSTDSFNVITDAVADDPSITASGDTGVEGSTLDVDIAGALGVDDFDGSESIVEFVISNVPNTITFNQGTDNLDGTWTFTQAQLAGLTATHSDSEFDGSIDLTATIYTVDTPNDSEFDTGDNTNSATDTLTLSWTPEIDPPSIKVNNGIDDVIVKEDGSVDVDITASLSAGASADEFLTVEVTGIDSSWGFSAPVGTYDATTETWTVDLAPGDDLNTVMSFTPPADSDLDLTGLSATATATDPVEGLSASSSDGFNIITDAVADTPDLSVSNASGDENATALLNISTNTTDTDGSEVIDTVIISNVPTGFSLTAGTETSPGVWELAQTDLAGLGIIIPNGSEGTYTLNVESIATEAPVSDLEDDFSDNEASAVDTITLTVSDDHEPIVAAPAPLNVDETDLVGGDIVVSDMIDADFGLDNPGTFTANDTFSSGGSRENNALSSNGVPVTVNVVGNTYVGTAGGKTVFTMDINATTGAYIFTQFENIDHADDTDPNDVINLTFGVDVSDSDGDTETTDITVNIADDAPTIDDVDDLVIPNDAGQYIGQIDVSGIEDGIDNFAWINGTEPNGVTYTVYGFGDTLPSSLTGAGITGPVEGGSLLVATIDATGDIFFTLDIDRSGEYTFDLINERPVVTSNVDFSTVPPGNYSSGIYYDADTAGWSQTDPGDAELFIHGSGSVNPSGAGIGIADNHFEINETVTFEFSTDINTATISTVRSAGKDSWDLEVKWSAYDDGALVDEGTVVFTGPGGTFTFSPNDTIKFDTLVLEGLDETESAFTNDSAKFTLSEMSYSEVFLPEELALDFEVQVTDGDGDMDTAPLGVTIVPPVLIVGKNVDDVDPSSETYIEGVGFGTITGSSTNDMLIGDSGGSFGQDQTQDFNVALILDVSGSMGSKSDSNSKLSLLINAVENLMAGFDGYESGTINVHVVPFSDSAHPAQTYSFTTGTDTALADAIDYLNNSMPSGGFTNYEHPMQQVISWYNSLGASDAENYTYFVSDGEPNRYVSGSNTSVSGSADTVMDQIIGSDGTDEVSDLQALSEVVGIGIDISGTTLARLSVIDSGTDSAINVTDPADLDSVFQNLSPLNKLANVGDDTINGDDGDDLIFGDVVFTDDLADSEGLTARDGAGWDIFELLESGQGNTADWSRSDTVEYLMTNASSLSAESIDGEGDPRDGGNDTLNGGGGDDVIFGQEGDDIINGGAGSDILSGSSGADIFLFENIGDGVDTITDFDISDGDVLDLTLILQGSYDETTDAIGDFVIANDNGTDTTLSVDLSGNAGAGSSTQLVTLQGVSGLTADDLLDQSSLVA